MKKTKFFWLLPILVIIFLVSACASPFEEEIETEPENGQEEIIIEELEFETLILTTDGGHEEEMFYIIADEETFIDLWVDTLEQEMMEVDFNESMVLAVFTGEKPSGGYQVEITQIFETDDTIEVMVLETAPGADDMVTMALTYPGHVIAMKTSDKEVIFNMNR